MFEQSLPVKRRVLGIGHPWTRYAMDELAIAYEHLGRQADALPLRRELLDWQTAGADKSDADANTLNGAARDLLTVQTKELRDPARALGYATRACALEEAEGGGYLWTYLDTLALAQHRAGDTAVAVETQMRSISLMAADHPERADYEQRLAEYEAARSEQAEPVEADR